jgi:hypothetical protein
VTVPERTPCSDPPCGHEKDHLCDTHETERAHAAGDHQWCGITCTEEFTSEKLRNGILWRAAPGSKAMLDELLRRARQEPPPAHPGTDPRQPAYDAVFAYIRSQPRDFIPTTVVERNAMIWHAVHAALDAVGVPGTPDKEA